ncbi:hypothetical protein EIN_165760 [Entamoeba invadens IP1]|uniref:Leucine rich repeat containing protein BspA family protein n=1 Tax=Entamoeba invadens IP1 TaxID=370355 RepID=A0A0A1UGE6_ENTIV|nr:hypothetical protein EIN_165760 [Entamoeba invadens IP1]ELP92601.1 hypothetical protein EIN_165760 [Entamoeba invadens IP1]|eukprot:XP_004259372.1 hypothetical protein EIN_165760 [Entamoeba invadens IP1]
MSQLDGYSIMIVSKYFKTIEDFKVITCVCKKFRENTQKFHFNPIQLTTSTLHLFPNVETFHFYKGSENIFWQDFIFNKKINPTQFYKMIVWCLVDYNLTQIWEYNNIEFKRVIYTRNDVNKYGVVIPMNVCSLHQRVFYNMPISTIELPCHLSAIRQFAFFCCSNLKEITLTNHIKTIGNSAFLNCSSLKKVVIPNSVTSLGMCCFSRCYSLQSISVPSSLLIINDNCFSYNHSLKEIKLSEGLNTLGFCRCFQLCETLEEITFPKSISQIPSHTCYRCGKLSKIVLSESLTRIGNGSFQECGIRELHLPQNVVEIGKKAFFKCFQLSKVEFNKGITAIQTKAFCCCILLNTVNIPDTVVFIGKCGFEKNVVFTGKKGLI